MQIFKKIVLALLLNALLLPLVACTGGNTPTESATPETTNPPSFETYQNPIIGAKDDDAKVNNGVGDPFVMRFNGRYYLYCSANGVGIQCWVSDDLVNWTCMSNCANESVTNGAYAPEVVYYNGYFYLYASPMGNGHYFFKSESPTGPFEVVTENLGLGIDGHVFIDDDGSWRFYRAFDNGIAVYNMDSPYSIDAESQSIINLDMFDNRYCWTEGPMIVKHNGTYYLTYAGNHVWSAAYRIHYAVSTDSPEMFTPGNNNPLLLSTDKKTVKGIGHSSTVVGPNLDEYYIVYHSFKTMGLRDMNIDRIVFNGTNTVSLGPSVTEQQVPQMPDLYSRFESDADIAQWDITNGSIKDGSLVLSAGGKAISKSKLGMLSDYTAEFNLKSFTDKAGIIFGYTDDNNYGKAVFDAASREITFTFTVDGKITTNKVSVMASFGEAINNNAHNTFTVLKSGSSYTFYLNSREIYKCQNQLGGGSIGVVCENGTASVGFVGGTNGALQSTLKDVYKSVETNIPAFTCNETDATTTVYDGASYLQMVEGKQYSYNVKVDKNGTYDLVINYKASSPCTVEVYQNNTKLGEVTLSGNGNDIAREAFRGLKLTKGAGTVVFKIKNGNVDMLDLSFHQAKEVTETTYDFSSQVQTTHKEGNWSTKDDQLSFKKEGYGKYMVGSDAWGDYAVQTEITPLSDVINVGLCVRVSNPASFEDGNKQKAFGGTYYLQGYYVGLTNDSIVLAKINYDWQVLDTVEYAVSKNTTYNIKVEVEANNIKVSVDGKEIFNYTDNDAPFLHGMVGYRTHESDMSADNLTISPLK